MACEKQIGGSVLNFQHIWLCVFGQPLKSVGLFPAASLVIGWGPKLPITAGEN